MENFLYRTNEPGTMEFPTSLASNMNQSASGSQPHPNLGMQYSAAGSEIQRDNYGATMPNVAVHRANAFEVPRFQLQYHQALSVPTFTSFPGGTFNAIVGQRPQLTPTNIQTVPIAGLTSATSFIPQTSIVQQQQQQQQPMGSLAESDTLPSFSSIVASAATSISTMNMQLTANSKISDNSPAQQMFAVQAAPNKTSVTPPHSMQMIVDNSQIQQVLFGAQLHSNIQQVPQQMQAKASGFFQTNHMSAVHQDVSSQLVSQPPANMQQNADSSVNTVSTVSCVQSAQATVKMSPSDNSQQCPVQILTPCNSVISNPSFTAAGLIPMNISARDHIQKDTTNSISLPPDSKQDDNENTLISIPETSNENSAPLSTDSQNSSSLNDFDTQLMIQISKPSLKHTIKIYPPRQSREKKKDCKPKSVLDSLSYDSTSIPFFYLGKFGDQSPWKHRTDCELYEFFDSLDLDDESTDTVTLPQDNNHIKTNPEFAVKSDRDKNKENTCMSLATFPKTSENISQEHTDISTKGFGKSKSVISSSSNENRNKRITSLCESSKLDDMTRKSQTACVSMDNNLPASGEEVSESGNQPYAEGGEEPSGDMADNSSQDTGVTPDGRIQQDSESEEEEHGAVFPGMDFSASGFGKPRSFFQVQPDIDDIPYLDSGDSEAEIKRKQWQATKERLEMERMDVHVKIEDSQCVLIGDHKRWQCNLCPKNYTTKHNLVTHILDHNGIKPHLCMVCGKYFKQLSHLNTHMLTHDNIKPHVCPLCGKGFTQVSHLKRHQAVHLDNKPNICDICNRGFAYPSELRVHREKHVPGRDKCVDCGEDFASPRLLKQHQATHEQREELTCNQCQRVFRYPSQLRDHIVSHTGTRPFICSECGMDFMKEHHLKAHMFTHTGLRPYDCKECGRAFNQKANLQRHMLIHSSERAYKCEQCDKTFTQPQTLKAHMVVHAEKKPYWCNVCGKEFGRLHNLQGHMHMHNNSKPYVCFCGSSFTLKGNLNRHKKVKHGLNESTESMEEEAVNFLNLMSERVREEKPFDDEEQEDYPNPPESSELDSPPFDQTGDAKSHRRERKSTPRKIPRQRKSVDNTDSSSKDNGEEEEETSRYFKALEDPSSGTVSSKRNQGCSSDEEESLRVPKAKRGRRSVQSKEIKVKEEIDEESQSDNEEEVKGEGDEDEEWCPSRKRPRLRRGAKLDSIIAKKFQSV